MGAEAFAQLYVPVRALRFLTLLFAPDFGGAGVVWAASGRGEDPAHSARKPRADTRAVPHPE